MNKKPIERVNFSKIKKTIGLPDLIEVQKDSFKFFLQSDLATSPALLSSASMEAPVVNRIEQGLEEVFREIFPIADFNETSVLEYISYTIEPAKYSPRESIDRNTTYAAPLKIRVRLVTYVTEEGMSKPTVRAGKESEVYLCDIPLMTERGTFVINGVERVIVSQLHRSPGIFFEDASAGKSVTEKHMYSARIIPYRGSWVDFEFDSKNILYVRIDKKRKIPVTVLLKALGMGEQEILSTYYKTEIINFEENGFSKAFDADKIRNQRFTQDVLDANGEVLLKANYAATKASARRMQRADIKTIRLTVEDLAESYFATNVTTPEGEVLVDANSDVTEEKLDLLSASNITSFEILLIDKSNADSVIRDILAMDKIKTPEEAQIEIYKKMRPGEPATEDAARTLFQNLFFNEKRYDLSRVGRLKINKRLGLDIPLEVTILTKEDIVETVRVLENIRVGNDRIDDIDHLGHRRVRAAGEQLQNHIRIGLARMEKTVKERMSIHDIEELTPQDLLNAKPLSASIKEFFGGYQLSQFMDQTNPLSEVTHKRRLSALGPGGLNRDRAGFEVRDVHTSHYGRICPIETPEGPNIGLITSLTTYAKINEFGFIETPYRKVVDGKVTSETIYMSPIEEQEYYIAQANAELDKSGRFVNELVAGRLNGESITTTRDNIQYMDVAPMQIVSISTALIPFLEHDDANRALMGSNMQRQAVPLIRTDAPIVGTGLERKVAVDAGSAIVSDYDGVIDYVDADKVIVRYLREKGSKIEGFGIEVYDLVKYRRSNQDTCINFRPTVLPGQEVKIGDTLADGAATDRGELALGHNTVIAFMPWMGYNYEDSILISNKLVKEDAFTSIHIEVFELEARDTKLGPEDISRDIPNVSEEALKDLDDAGVIRIGAKVTEGDILVGKVTPKGETQATPEEKLLRAIFGDKAGDVKDASMRVPPGITGTVVNVQIMTRRGIEKCSRTLAIEQAEADRVKFDYDLEMKAINNARREGVAKWLLGKTFVDGKKKKEITADMVADKTYAELSTMAIEEKAEFTKLLNKLTEIFKEKARAAEDKLKDRRKKIEKGDELPAGVLKSVRVYVAIKRKLSVGDKMAGRHGNKGVVSRILPEEDMPYLPDGTAAEIVLNPLAIPSRMNVGQVLEMHLGWAARALGLHMATEVFDGAKESDIKALLKKAGLQEDGQTILYDGRTGERFDQEVTVGVMYMLKLHHLVDTKIHARSTGPYSLVTQQPLGGKAQFGGQRLGEMEVWALYAYGAANVLQEMLTVKSDDVEGRTDVYQAIVNGSYSFKPSMPESFNVLIKELQGLVLDVELLTDGELESTEAQALVEAEEE